MSLWNSESTLNHGSTRASWAVWESPAIFARLQSAKELGGVEYRSVGVVIKKDTHSESHQWSHGGTEQQTKGV